MPRTILPQITAQTRQTEGIYIYCTIIIVFKTLYQLTNPAIIMLWFWSFDDCFKIQLQFAEGSSWFMAIFNLHQNVICYLGTALWTAGQHSCGLNWFAFAQLWDTHISSIGPQLLYKSRIRICILQTNSHQTRERRARVVSGRGHSDRP